MDDNEYFPLGLLDGIEVGVQPALDGQDILIRHSDLGQRLACLLAFGRTDIVRREEVYYWRIAHDRQVDGLLVELIDLLISIRYAHPTLVQLELALPAPPVPSGAEGSEAEGDEAGGMISEPTEP